MKLKLIFSFLTGAALLAACGPAPTPQQQAARQHEIACLGGTLGGALIGGAIGNQFGGGSGKTILTAAGAAAGGIEGQRFAC
ncbi:MULTISPECIES: glycine zipper 2TM domain-containing protein [Ruegeria]|uniref:glycine zipper 2TM domain-containing protein n=1 Tax=Ruegeria TaxID=97050 RepID=UPI00147AFDA8|nr:MULTISPECIES: glycine zipper 2TM domain-containing protein [Ruegeria]UUV05789.1 glycine zipper 2TM domain-containing protein [Ruegeria sp. YS9]